MPVQKAKVDGTLQFLAPNWWTHILKLLYTEFLIEYYEYFFDCLITITNQFTINAHT